jgi:hypothetical protein
MSNGISIVKNVIDKQQNKASVTNYESRYVTSVKRVLEGDSSNVSS